MHGTMLLEINTQYVTKSTPKHIYNYIVIMHQHPYDQSTKLNLFPYEQRSSKANHKENQQAY